MSFPASPRLSPLSISPIRLSLATLAPTPQAEAGRVELELSMTKLRVEEASLRDSLSKLSALNESLAQDKLGLNRLVAQVCRVPAGRPPVCPTQKPYSLRCPRPSLGPRPSPSLHISLYTSGPVPVGTGPGPVLCLVHLCPCWPLPLFLCLF